MKNSTDIEKKLLYELSVGSYEAYTAIYNKYAQHLYAFVFNLTKTRILAEDIVQETFINLWTHHENININQSFKSYLYAIARNQVISHFRKQINKPEMIDYLDYINEPVDNSVDIDNLIDFETFCQQLNKAKQHLTQQKRLIFVLCKEDGKSVAEVADLLGITEQSVRNQLSAALAILRKELGYWGCLFLFMFYNT